MKLRNLDPGGASLASTPLDPPMGDQLVFYYRLKVQSAYYLPDKNLFTFSVSTQTLTRIPSEGHMYEYEHDYELPREILSRLYITYID